MKNLHIKNTIINLNNTELSLDFIEWFRGFTDAEGCFQITKRTSGSFEFRYSIGLHIDDQAALKYIQENLQIGKVTLNNRQNIATYNVMAKEEVTLLIQLFSMFNLNSNKHLNFLTFKEAFILYDSLNNNNRPEIITLIENLKSSMNTKRTEFLMPKEHSIKITPYWMLGFIEGDGSFSFKTLSKSAFFTIGQKGNKELLLDILDFLNNLGINNQTLNENTELDGLLDNSINNNRVNLSVSKDIYSINTSNVTFIQYALIPLLDSLNWRTKKYLDYSDWKYLIAILIKGFHYLPKGIELIEKITNQMNNYRLSTYEPKVQSVSFKSEVEELLKQPSNYEIKEGKLFITSLNRFRINNTSLSLVLVDLNTNESLNLFSSQLECANYLGIARSTVKNRVLKGQSFLFKDRLVILKRNN